MNLLYCGDENMQDGILLSLMSILKEVNEPLHVYILTMAFYNETKVFHPIQPEAVKHLNQLVKEHHTKSSVQLIRVDDLFNQCPPTANMHNHFTPFATLRLYADLVPEIPDCILYLDADVICCKDFTSFYYQELDEFELAAVLDYYGRWFFHQNYLKFDYFNSGILLLNMAKIRQTQLFKRARLRCQKHQMLMPDQSALNKEVSACKLCPRRFNEQHVLQAETVFQHFTTQFRFLPVFHTLTVKPWEIDKMHEVLHLHAHDDLLAAYLQEMKSAQSGFDEELETVKIIEE